MLAGKRDVETGEKRGELTPPVMAPGSRGSVATMGSQRSNVALSCSLRTSLVRWMKWSGGRRGIMADDVP